MLVDVALSIYPHSSLVSQSSHVLSSVSLVEKDTVQTQLLALNAFILHCPSPRMTLFLSPLPALSS